MSAEQLLDEMSRIWQLLPSTVDELTAHIDKYIFEAQKGYNKCVELLIIYSDRESETSVSYKKAMAGAMIEARQLKIAATARKDYCIPVIVQEDVELTRAKFDVHKAELMRDKWYETMCTFKKIKGESQIMRGGGY